MTYYHACLKTSSPTAEEGFQMMYSRSVIHYFAINLRDTLVDRVEI